MDVRLSPEHRALQETAAQMADRLGPGTVRDLDDHERAAKLDAAVTASGWRELRAAGDDGGPWTSAVEVAIVAEELARGLADTSFAGPVLAADLRRLAGASPATAPETVVLTADLTAPARSGGHSLTAAAVAFDAAGATRGLVLTGDDALATVPVDTGSGGVDLTRSTVPVPAGTSVTSLSARATAATALPGRVTAADVARWTALGLALTSADLVGTMCGAIRLACDYAGSRRQFGTTIGSFQAIQHLLADAHVAMEGSRSIALHAAWAVDALEPGDAVAAAAAAKAYCARAARSVCETVIQVHGGIGNTWECLAHVYLRRAIATADLLGGVGPSLARVLEHHGVGGARGLR